MRYQAMAQSTRDILLGQLLEETLYVQRGGQPVAASVVTTALLDRLRIKQLLDDLEIEYANKV